MHLCVIVVFDTMQTLKFKPQPIMVMFFAEVKLRGKWVLRSRLLLVNSRFQSILLVSVNIMID